MTHKGTKQAAQDLGVPPTRLQQIVWNGKIPEPSRIGRRFAWSLADVQRAATVLNMPEPKDF